MDRERRTTSRRMVLPLTDELRVLIAQERDLLDETPNPEAVVFRDSHGEGWKYKPYRYQFGYFCKTRLNFSVCARDLRVTYGTLQAEAGRPQHILAELMSHDDVTTALKYYTRVNFEGMQRAAAKYTENVKRLSSGA